MAMPDKNMLLKSKAVTDLSSGRMPKRANHCSLVLNVAVDATVFAVAAFSMAVFLMEGSVIVPINVCSFAGRLFLPWQPLIMRYSAPLIDLFPGCPAYKYPSAQLNGVDIFNH
jgi:hypothetical protein